LAIPEEKMKKTLRVVIVHGAYGSPEENWFPWLKEQLESDGHQVIVPRFPTPEGQNPKAWLDILNKEAPSFDKNLIMVGHSLGPALILRKLENVEKPIRATFLVSVFVGALGLPDFDPINIPFFDPPFNWAKIRKNSSKFYVYNSDNDPYVPLVQGERVAEKLGVKLNVVKGGGHINASAGFTKFERLLTDIRSLK